MFWKVFTPLTFQKGNFVHTVNSDLHQSIHIQVTAQRKGKLNTQNNLTENVYLHLNTNTSALLVKLNALKASITTVNGI